MHTLSSLTLNFACPAPFPSLPWHHLNGSPIRNIEIPEVELSPSVDASSPSRSRRSRRRRQTSGGGDGEEEDEESKFFSSPSHRPRRRRHRRPFSSGIRPRSPSHPNYKEDAYLLTHVRLQYVGHQLGQSGGVGERDDLSDIHPQGGRRHRHRRRGRSRPQSAFPAHVDEVTIVQQPRGSYVLEVFHGYLAVGGRWMNGQRHASTRCNEKT